MTLKKSSPGYPREQNSSWCPIGSQSCTSVSRRGSRCFDRPAVDERGRIGLPQDDPKYVLQRVWLTRAEEDGYYYGLSNTAIWPLCHHVYTRPHFSRRDWETYRCGD